VAAIGGLFERLVLTRLKTNPLGQVLVTLGMSFIISDACLMLWGGDSIPVPTPQNLQAPTRVLGFVFPTYRLVLVGCAIAAAIALYFLLERTRLGAMIRAGVDDRQMARAVGIPVSNLFTIVFCLGAGIAGAGGVLGGPILSAYPGLDGDMLPLALIVVILGGIGSLLGRLRRQLHHRLHLYVRHRAVSGAGLHHPVPADDLRDRVPAPGPVWARRRMKWIAAALLAALLVALPFFAGDFYVNLASQILIAAIFALSLNLLVGYGGMTSLGHASYLGVAAYISALMTSRYGWGHGPAALLSILGTTAMAAFFGLIALRATGLGFLMITLALSQVLWGLAYRMSDVTNGDNGIAGLTRPMPFGFSLDSAASFYWFALIVAWFAFLMMTVFVSSSFGSSLKGGARPAAPDGRAGLQSLDDPLDHLHLCRFLGRHRRIAVRLLQQIHPPDLAFDHELGRSPARRHRRRVRYARRPGGRRRAGAAAEELRLGLSRTLEHAARAGVPVHRSGDAQRDRPGLSRLLRRGSR
jgi:ABC-type branched-subunit amino acid transport system permease subunit